MLLLRGWGSLLLNKSQHINTCCSLGKLFSDNLISVPQPLFFVPFNTSPPLHTLISNITTSTRISLFFDRTNFLVNVLFDSCATNKKNPSSGLYTTESKMWPENNSHCRGKVLLLPLLFWLCPENMIYVKRISCYNRVSSLSPSQT